MKFFQSWQNWLLLAIFCLGFFLRFFQYAQFPVGGETQDEAAWTMLGSSLLQTGVPKSWSYFSGYTVEKVIAAPDGALFTIIRPALDHPPLFALIPGIVQTLRHQSWDSFPSFVAIRFPMVLLSCCNLILFWLWIRKILTEKPVQILAVALAATVPAWVFLSRLAVSENLLTTWMLLLLCLQAWKKLPTKIRWWGFFLVSAALPLTKVAGIPIAVASLLFSWIEGDKKAWKSQMFGLITGVLLWFGYAARFNFATFIQVQTQQASRDTGLLTFFKTMFWSQSLVEKPFGDIWSAVGLVSLLGVSAVGIEKGKNQAKERVLLLVGLLSLAYIAFLLLSVGENTVHGWYHIPLWPLFAFSIIYILRWLWQTQRFIGMALLALVSLAQIRLGLWYLLTSQMYGIQGNINKLLLIIIGFFVAAAIFLPDRWRRRITNIFVIVWLIFLFVSNILVITNIQQTSYWQDALFLQEGLRT